MSNRRVTTILAAALIGVSALLLRVAIHNDAWREFVVTEIGLVLTAGALFFLLRDKREQ